MPFAPREIEDKEFLISLRGYNRDEVRAFLRAAAADYRAALERVDRSKGHGELEARAERHGDVVLTSDQAAEHLALVRKRADAEGAEIRMKAQRNGRRILEEAERRAAEVREEVERHANERLGHVTRKIEELRILEERMARRLYFIETALELARRDLHPGRTDPEGDDDGVADGLPVTARQYLPSNATNVD